MSNESEQLLGRATEATYNSWCSLASSLLPIPIPKWHEMAPITQEHFKASIQAGLDAIGLTELVTCVRATELLDSATPILITECTLGPHDQTCGDVHCTICRFHTMLNGALAKIGVRA